MTVDECDVRNIIAEVLIEAINWRLRECIRVKELAATHRLEQMRRLRILEEQKAWKQEIGFDRIETADETDAQRFRTSLVSEPSSTSCPIRDSPIVQTSLHLKQELTSSD